MTQHDRTPQADQNLQTTFGDRHIGTGAADQRLMLETVGYDSSTRSSARPSPPRSTPSPSSTR